MFGAILIVKHWARQGRDSGSVMFSEVTTNKNPMTMRVAWWIVTTVVRLCFNYIPLLLNLHGSNPWLLIRRLNVPSCGGLLSKCILFPGGMCVARLGHRHRSAVWWKFLSVMEWGAAAGATGGSACLPWSPLLQDLFSHIIYITLQLIQTSNTNSRVNCSAS